MSALDASSDRWDLSFLFEPVLWRFSIQARIGPRNAEYGLSSVRLPALDDSISRWARRLCCARRHARQRAQKSDPSYGGQSGSSTKSHGGSRRRFFRCRTLAFDFTVMSMAPYNPSRVTWSGPRPYSVSPGTLKGRKTHRKAIKPLTGAKRTSTRLMFMRAVKISATGKRIAIRKPLNERFTATATEKDNALMILTLGSSL
jgi:hypothetical protein